MNIIKCSHCFELRDHTAFYQKISSEISDRLTIIEDLDRMLLLHLKTIVPQFDCQSILIDFLQSRNPIPSASLDAANTRDDQPAYPAGNEARRNRQFELLQLLRCKV
jgi:hypothetical protein